MTRYPLITGAASQSGVTSLTYSCYDNSTDVLPVNDAEESRDEPFLLEFCWALPALLFVGGRVSPAAAAAVPWRDVSLSWLPGHRISSPVAVP